MFSDRLKQLRAAAGLTQEQLAEQSGYTQQNIDRMERGLTTQPRRVDALANALGVSPAALFYGDTMSDQKETPSQQAQRLINRIQELDRSGHLSCDVLESLLKLLNAITKDS